MTRILQLEKKDDGSATIEAVVAFTGFLFTIFTILNIVNFCRTQVLISNAIDTTAKELSQYAYFYEMSGLQKLSDDIKGNSDVGKSKINDVIGSVDTLYTSLTGAADSTASRVTEVTNAINDQSMNSAQIEAVINGVTADGANVLSSIELLSANINNIIANPISYIKSLVAVAANGALDKAKSAVIAVPLSKAFFVKHFGDNVDEASQYLENLGVVGGFENMNFNDSTIFQSSSKNDVHIVVYYKLQMIQLFKFAEMNATIKKEALAGCWLGGDHVITKVVDDTPAADETVTSEPAGAENTTGEEESSASEETTAAEEITTAEETTVNTEGSLWHLPKEYTQNEKFQDEAFLEELYNKTGISNDIASLHLKGRNSKNEAYGIQYCVDAESAENIGWNIAKGVSTIDHLESPDNNLSLKYDAGSTVSYTCYVYVPENISDDELKKIQKTVKDDYEKQLYYERTVEGTTIEIPVYIEYVKGGGNYDYGG